jgi:hypothetical protein
VYVQDAKRDGEVVVGLRLDERNLVVVPMHQGGFAQRQPVERQGRKPVLQADAVTF